MVRIAKLRTAGTHYPMLNLILTLIAFTRSIGWPWFGIVLTVMRYEFRGGRQIGNVFFISRNRQGSPSFSGISRPINQCRSHHA